MASFLLWRNSPHASDPTLPMARSLTSPQPSQSPPSSTHPTSSPPLSSPKVLPAPTPYTNPPPATVPQPSTPPSSSPTTPPPQTSPPYTRSPPPPTNTTRSSRGSPYFSPPPKNSTSSPPPPPPNNSTSGPPTRPPPPVSSPPPPPKKKKFVPPPPTPSPPPHPRPASNPSSPPVITLHPPPASSTNSPLPSVIVPSFPPANHPTDVKSRSNDYRSPRKSPSNASGIGTRGIVGISIVLSLILLTTIVTALWCRIKRKKKLTRHNGLYDMSTSTGNSPRSTSGLLKNKTSSVGIGSLSTNSGLGSSSLKFTYEDLYEATNGFSQRNILGLGGFGYVYKGFLADGMEVAVKELNTGSRQGEREFTAEVEIISRIHHRYLVSLVGYCISGNKRLLVYEYVPNNTLYHHLRVPELVLDWSTRVRIAAGAARGIAYLHEDCHPRVIHRDIKSSNILLNENFDARVSDFGLAKLAADVCTHVTTRVMGTFGYMAPEYASSGMLSEKSDVFSFGVVLLELITGRKPVDMSQPLGDEGLVEWARPLLSRALETKDYELLVDPKIGMNYVPNEMFCMIEASAACIRHTAKKRPCMGQIVRAFENLETKDLSNGLRFGENELYNSAQQRFQRFQRMEFDGQDYSTDVSTQTSCATDSKEM